MPVMASDEFRMMGIALPVLSRVEGLHPSYGESDRIVGWVEAPCADTHRIVVTTTTDEEFRQERKQYEEA